MLIYDQKFMKNGKNHKFMMFLAGNVIKYYDLGTLMTKLQNIIKVCTKTK